MCRPQETCAERKNDTMQTGPHILRQKFVQVLVILIWMFMGAKLFEIQFLRHEELQRDARSQRKKTVTVEGARGGIYDRNGKQLAMNRESASYGIRKEYIEDMESEIALISLASDISVQEIRKRLNTRSGFQYLVRLPDNVVMEALDTLNLKCIEKEPQLRRYYPLGKIAAQVVGYTDIDLKGIDGSEYFFNGELSPRMGRSIMLYDARRQRMPSFDEPPIVEPRDGRDIYLTIDWRIQEIAEEELESGVQKFNARSGGVIVLDTENGTVLAMANVPRFDPNDPAYFDPLNFRPEYRRNKLLTDMIEPGSTFKIVTFIEALESGIIDENTTIDCENGAIKIGRHSIKDTHKMGTVSAAEVLIHSSNIGTLKIADMIGKRNFYRRARMMGFGEVTGFDLPGESPGDLPDPRTWSKLSLPTMSFGQGVAVSPLQICMAYAAVANGGLLVSPRIIKEIRGTDDRPGQTMKEKKIRRAMKEETAARIEELLSKAVEEGTGNNAAVPNIRIAGKTGTAQRVIEGKKGYAPGVYVSSFIGFNVERDPQILCFVMVDSPQGVHYGSQVAAPIFRNIMNRILNIRDNPWTNMVAAAPQTESPAAVTLPNLQDTMVRDAVIRLSHLGMKSVVFGDSTRVVRQFPLGGAELTVGSSVTLYTAEVTSKVSDAVSVPNLVGKTMRIAVQHLVQSNLNVHVSGSGVVMSQEPEAGTLVKYGTVCTIACNKR